MGDLPRLEGPGPFQIASLVVDAAAQQVLDETGAKVYTLLYKLLSSEWGLIDTAVHRTNQQAIAEGYGDVFAVYALRPDIKVIVNAELTDGEAAVSIFRDTDP